MMRDSSHSPPDFHRPLACSRGCSAQGCSMQGVLNAEKWTFWAEEGADFSAQNVHPSERIIEKRRLKTDSGFQPPLRCTSSAILKASSSCRPEPCRRMCGS